MLKLYTHPASIVPPLVNYRGIGSIKTGQEAVFPGFGSGVVTATGTKTSIISFAGIEGMPNTQGVYYSSQEMGFHFHPRQVIGRILDWRGRPLDNKPPMVGSRLNVYGEILNPAERTIAQGVIMTGYPALDVKEPMPQGIKILWMKRPEQNIDAIIGRTMISSLYRRNKEEPWRSPVVVFCGMGLLRQQMLYYVEEVFRKIEKTVFVIHQASEPPMGALIAPHVACQIAEQLALQGEEVLLIGNDMRAFYTALAEVRGIQGMPPGKDNSPVDFYSQAARIYERAFLLARGSLTSIFVMSAPSLDESEMGINLTKYSTEGHILWQLSDVGNPTIDFLPSLSRLKGDAIKATRKDHKYCREAIVAAYTRAGDVRKMASMIGEDKITNPTDKAHLRFLREFTREILDTSEFLSPDTALNRCWHTLGLIPRESIHIPPEILNTHYQARNQ